MKIASSLKKSFKTDNIFRIGGDEFVILITSNDNYDEKEIKDRFNDVVSYLQDSSDNVPKTTISGGVVLGDTTDTGDSLYKKADKALYKAKANGKNNIDFYNKKA